jgi:hypothetical protein
MYAEKDIVKFDSSIGGIKGELHPMAESERWNMPILRMRHKGRDKIDLQSSGNAVFKLSL